MLILRKHFFINQLKLLVIILLLTAELCESKRSRPLLKKKLLTSKIKATFKISKLKNNRENNWKSNYFYYVDTKHTRIYILDLYFFNFLEPLRKPSHRPLSENKSYSLHWPHAEFGHVPQVTTMQNANNIQPFGTMDPFNYLSYTPSLPFPLNAMRRGDLHIPAPLDSSIPLWQPHVVYKIINDDTLENLHPRRTNIQQGFFANQPLLQFSNPVDFNFGSERFVFPSQLGTNIFGSLV